MRLYYFSKYRESPSMIDLIVLFVRISWSCDWVNLCLFSIHGSDFSSCCLFDTLPTRISTDRIKAGIAAAWWRTRFEPFEIYSGCCWSARSWYCIGLEPVHCCSVMLVQTAKRYHPVAWYNLLCCDLVPSCSFECALGNFLWQGSTCNAYIEEPCCY